ncbi:MAG: ribosomal-processing cysteine protease Prp, partial [Spirochaetes bacterium]|nr:ribosomal-processing cysteine protease Prp [Spirochaetota bacterium]
MIFFRIYGFDNNIPAETVVIEIQGHAGFAVKGNDIVCAAASVLVQTLQFTVSKELLLQQNVEKNDDLYKLTIVNNNERNSELSLLIKNCLFGLELLQQNYPDHLKI